MNSKRQTQRSAAQHKTARPAARPGPAAMRETLNSMLRPNGFALRNVRTSSAQRAGLVQARAREIAGWVVTTYVGSEDGNVYYRIKQVGRAHVQRMFVREATEDRAATRGR